MAYIPGLLAHSRVDRVDRGKGRGGAKAEQKSKDCSEGCHLDCYCWECDVEKDTRRTGKRRTQIEVKDRQAKRGMMDRRLTVSLQIAHFPLELLNVCT
jgi:hypothetical protein